MSPQGIWDDVLHGVFDTFRHVKLLRKGQCGENKNCVFYF